MILLYKLIYVISYYLPQVATAQLEAIRLENRHLRRSAVSGSRSNLSDSGDLMETEKHLKEIQTAYGETIKSLEVGEVTSSLTKSFHDV